ncbi:mucin TcMUC [Trypanosoma cruzi Dm28c]|uniref:Mucin TcMUC n=1 Tax=Trypanosoma cruzi Dm28c TaxID=1416333 RepID=V5BDM2_TRYCR|nr:mucin TcMUC [Trypanosoma cruzi Dm28c]
MDHERLCFIHCRNASAVGNCECDCLGVSQPARRLVSDGMLATFVRTALALLTRYCNSIQKKQHNKLLCDECWLRFPWTNDSRGVRGSFLFLLLLCFCVVVCAAPPLVCVRTLREECRHDGPLSPCVHAVEPCVPLLFASPSSICVLVLRQGCVCVCPAAVEWSVCRAWCAAYGACLAAALSSCGVPSVCLPHLSSPLLLSMSLTVQISSTPLNDHTHDDDVPSAVRPVGACPVLLPVRVRGRAYSAY